MTLGELLEKIAKTISKNPESAKLQVAIVDSRSGVEEYLDTSINIRISNGDYEVNPDEETAFLTTG
jgi:hypothetical protein